MSVSDKPEQTTEPKQYLQNISRRLVYGGLIAFALIAGTLFVAVPHYKPVKLASLNDLQNAHHDIIKQYFVAATTCKHDNRDKTDRIKTFNKYFKVNQYGNRAVLRGCNDADQMLAKDDTGKWITTDVNIVLSARQNPEWQKACLILDITTADTNVRPENTSIDANNLKVCDSLGKQSYIQQWFN